MSDLDADANNVPPVPVDARPLHAALLSSEPKESPYLFSDLAIDPPVNELRRMFSKKLRSFESDGDEARLATYQRAFRLAEEKLLRRLGEERA